MIIIIIIKSFTATNCKPFNLSVYDRLLSQMKKIAIKLIVKDSGLDFPENSFVLQFSAKFLQSNTAFIY